MKEVLEYNGTRFLNFGEVNLEFTVGRPVFSKQCVHVSARGIFNYGSSARTSSENAGRNSPQYELYRNFMSKQDVSMLWQAVFIT